jgi:hypothetical protein
VLSRQRAYLLRELRSLADARAHLAPGLPLAHDSSPVVDLLLTAAELHARADLGVVDAAEQGLRPEVLEALRGPGASQQTGDGPTEGGGGAADIGLLGEG